MKNYRIYVEKYPRFQVEADTLRKELNNNLGLNLQSLRLLNVYDIVNAKYLVIDQNALAAIEEVYA